MKNTTALLVIGIILLGGGILVFKNADSVSGDASVQGQPTTGEVQKIILRQEGYQYAPATITVQAGIPVELHADDTVRGCGRSVAIQGLGVSKYLPTADDALVFTPMKKGSFPIQCSMGMVRGTRLVVT